MYPPEAGIAFVRRELLPSPRGEGYTNTSGVFGQQVEPGGLHAFECCLIPDGHSDQRENQVYPVPQNVRRHRVTDGYNSHSEIYINAD